MPGQGSLLETASLQLLKINRMLVNMYLLSLESRRSRVGRYHGWFFNGSDAWWHSKNFAEERREMGFIGRATGTVKLRASFPLTAPIENPSVPLIPLPPHISRPLVVWNPIAVIEWWGRWLNRDDRARNVPKGLIVALHVCLIFNRTGTYSISTTLLLSSQ